MRLTREQAEAMAWDMPGPFTEGQLNLPKMRMVPDDTISFKAHPITAESLDDLRKLGRNFHVWDRLPVENGSGGWLCTSWDFDRLGWVGLFLGNDDVMTDEAFLDTFSHWAEIPGPGGEA